MPEFLAEDNACGQNLLQIVAVGNAIIAELLRLKDYIPDVFRLESKQDQQKYAEIILDFSYFKISDVQDRKIEDDPDLQDLDDGFRENFIDILTRFYLAFESIHQYIVSLNTFIDELNDGQYIQQTIENILQDDEGKQLLCESLYLYGVMLVIVDLHIPGIVRERLLVSYHRYSAQKSNSDSNIDDVCKLLRSTGFRNVCDSKRLTNYPDDYFRRIPIDELFIEMVIGRLRSDDIYNQVTVYPLPEHRTTALANQASMLYICLFFSPKTLHQQHPRMREIVDKFFSDNWIVSIYMGCTVNLIDTWDPYKAAKMALQNTIDPVNIKEISLKHYECLQKILPQSRHVLKEGILNQQILIKNISKTINLVRECNVTLRWLILHTNQSTNFEYTTTSISKKCKQIQDNVCTESKYKSMELFELLLNTGQLEFRIREIIKQLLIDKEKLWLDYRRESYERICELAEVFSGIKPLIKIEKNEILSQWFSEISRQINQLDQLVPNVSGRKIIQLIQALEEVQEFHNLDSNMQIKQHLLETRQYLHQMIHTINIKEEILISLQLIGDLSYAWHIIDRYTIIMQESIKKQPNIVSKLRATFLKLSSALEIPLLRINQAHSDDLISVSKYYSNELINYVRKVVQIIPETMFGILSQIIHLQTDVIKELPTRLEKERLKEYAQLDDRYAVARLTYSLSVFTEGILMMKTTLVGVIELDPKQLLEDGIRKELVNHLSITLHNGLIFDGCGSSTSSTSTSTSSMSELEMKLSVLAKQIDGYRRSFEYVQDYLNVYGYKIWQEELTRVINYNVEKECNGFLRKKVQDWQSEYQIISRPIPVFLPIDSESVNFIGRLAREILTQSNPRSTIYIESNTTWYDYKTHRDLLNMNFFTKITDSIGPAGLVGLDKLYSHMIVADLQQLIQSLQKKIIKETIWIDLLKSLANDLTSQTTGSQSIKFYNQYITRCTKIWPQLLDWIVHIGQKQILREHIAYELNKSCKFNSKNLESSLRTMNEALLWELKSARLDDSTASMNSPLKLEMLYELNKYLEWAGIYRPLDKIYLTTKNFNYFPLLLFLFVIANLPKLQYMKTISSILGKKLSEHIDGTAFVYGLVTVLKQFHRNNMDLFLHYIGQYVTSIMEYNLSNKREMGPEPQITLYFLQIFSRIADIPKSYMETCIPNGILNQFEFLSMKS